MLDEDIRASLNSLKVFQLPHSGHLPIYAGASYPHSWQTNDTFSFLEAMGDSIQY
jgi:hypothetical protein